MLRELNRPEPTNPEGSSAPPPAVSLPLNENPDSGDTSSPTHPKPIGQTARLESDFKSGVWESLFSIGSRLAETERLV